MNLEGEINKLSIELKDYQTMLIAIGNEVRQHLILTMIQSGNCNGMRVGDIAEKTNLSRPAVSHHLKILKNAGIVKMRREATKNYYYFDADMTSFNQLIEMLVHSKEIMSFLPDRSGEDT